MPDNYSPSTDAALSYASDDVAGVQFPIVKLDFGANGASAPAAGGIPGTYAEDAAHASGDRGLFVLAVQQTADTAFAGDGDYTALQVDETGRLKTANYPASQAATTGSITANAQTVAINVSRTSNVVIGMVATSLVGHNVAFEASVNSTNGSDGTWYAVQVVRSNANTIETTSGVLAATPAYLWEASVNGYAWFRVRATAHTSGTAAYTIQPAPFASEPIPAAQISGTQPVSGTVTATGVAGAAAHDAAISGNPVRIAGRALTANYTGVATGDVADLVTTVVGALISKPYAIPEADWTSVAGASGIVNTTTAVTIKAAAAAGIRNYVTSLQIATDTLGGATELAIRDGAAGAVLWRTKLQTGPLPLTTIVFPTPLRGTAATLLEVVTLTAVTGGVYVNAQGYIAP